MITALAAAVVILALVVLVAFRRIADLERRVEAAERELHFAAKLVISDRRRAGLN